MAHRGVLVETYDAPADEEFTNWIYASRYPEVFAIYPGIRSIRRYEMSSDKPGQQRILMVLETDDVEGVEICRRTGRGLAMKRDADERGVGNRQEHWGRLIYEAYKRDDGTLEATVVNRSNE